jgi:integrase
MADVDDRWFTVDRATGARVPTARHGTGKRWLARWRDDTGRQVRKSFERRADAERFVAQMATDLARGAYSSPAAGKVRLAAYAEMWLAAQTSDPSTREAVALRLRLHILPALGGYELRALRPSTVQAWTRGLQGQLAPNYIRVIFANLSAILQAAVDDGLIARNPCRAGSVRPPAPDRRRVVPWSAEQVAAVADALPDRYRALVAVGAGCGLRQGELFGLAVEDVDFLRGLVHVRRQVKIVSARLVFALPKSGRQRDVPLAEQVALRLAAHLQTWPAVAITLPGLPSGRPETARLLFSTRERTALDRTYLNRHVWKPALDAAGVPATRDNGMHALRHHFASVLLEGGVSVKALAEYLGHADPGFTLRTYTHLMPASEDRARQAVDRALTNTGRRAAADGAGAPNVPRGIARMRSYWSGGYDLKCRSRGGTPRGGGGGGRRRPRVRACRRARCRSRPG